MSRSTRLTRELRSRFRRLAGLFAEYMADGSRVSVRQLFVCRCRREVARPPRAFHGVARCGVGEVESRVR